ncbi:MAG: signal peptidase I [Haloferacaceae archaeon]
MLRSVGLVGVLVLLLVATAPTGAPVQLSYVYSDSMEPTIGVNDGYVVVPAGDVVTFWSPERDAYVTHRVVRETDDGFVTKGDNNPSTDQAAGYPPVSRDQVQGRVLTVRGEPFVIPALGAAVAFVRANASVLLALVFAGGALLRLRTSVARPSRDVVRVRDLALVVFLVGFGVAAGFPVYASTSQDVSVVAVDSPAVAAGPSAVLVGSTADVRYEIRQPAHPLTTRVVAVDGATVTGTTRTATNLTVTATVPPRSETGPVPIHVTVAQYPSVLPTPTLTRLHGIHPLAAGVVTAATIFAPLWLLFRLAVDGAEPLRRSRSRWWAVLTEGLE